MNIIKVAKSKLRDTKNMKEQIDLNKKYLRADNYIYQDGPKPIIHNGSEKSLEFIRKTEKSEKSLKGLVLMYLRKIYLRANIDRNISSFQGDLLMFVRNQDVKIYNFDKNVLLTAVYDKERYVKLKNNYEEISKCLHTTYIKSNDKEQVIYEQIIDFKPYQDWTVEDKVGCINAVTQSSKKNIANKNTKKNLLITTENIYKNFTERIQDKKFIEMIKSSLSLGSLKDEWILTKQHGDMNYSNILLSNNRYYFIDWEHTNNLIFFHDFLHFVLWESAYLGNRNYINKFLSGEYDYYLSSLFNTVSIDYNCNNRNYYLVLYMMEFLTNAINTGWIDELPEDIISVYKNELKRITYESSSFEGIKKR